MARPPYSTKLPSSQRSATFSRAVRRPRAWRRSTASGRAASASHARRSSSSDNSGAGAVGHLGRHRRGHPDRGAGQLEERVAGRDGLPRTDETRRDRPLERCVDVVLHLHGLEHDDGRPLVDTLTARGAEQHHGRLHGRGDDDGFAQRPAPREWPLRRAGCSDTPPTLLLDRAQPAECRSGTQGRRREDDRVPVGHIECAVCPSGQPHTPAAAPAAPTNARVAGCRTRRPTARRPPCRARRRRP